MREGWKEVDLGDYIETQKGFAFKSSWYNSFGVPVVRVSDFTENSISTNEINYISNNLAQEHIKHELQFRDILIQTVGSWQSNPASIVGKVVTVPIELEGALLNQNAVKIIPKSGIDKRFLYYRLKEENFKFHNLNHAQGAANQASITLESIKKFNFLLPPLPTQRKIASILSSYDDLIENNLKRIKLLEEKAQRTYEEWFVKMRFPGHETAVFNQETGLPEGWEKVKLVDCCELIMGQSPKSEYYNNDQKGLPFHQGVKDYGFRFPINTCWSTEGNRFALENDILFSVRAPVGRLNVAIEKLILGRGLAAIRHKQKCNSFILYQLKNIFFEDNLMGGGAIFQSVTKKDVEDVKIINPSNNILENYEEVASSIDKSIKNLTKQNRHLKEARDILLPRLMSGMVDVEELQIETIIK